MTYNDRFAQSMLSSDFYQSSVFAGCTYIGQMISHDIVGPTSRSSQPARASLSWALNLNSIFDDLDRFCNASLFNYTTTNAVNLKHKGYDFIRKPNKNPKKRYAKITEKRNDENAIISQLHVFWQRLYNKLVTDFKKDRDEAQRIVTLAFQLVVIHDFLHQLMPPKIFKQYFVNNKTYLDNSILGISSGHVPDFFSKASFRFGHTMVRSAYHLNAKNDDVKLATLFSRHQALNPDNAIDWELFFLDQNSKSIDTLISDTMGMIPRNDNISPVHIIPKLNLEASQGLCANCFINTIKAQENWLEIESDCNLKILDHNAMDGASFKMIEPDINKLTLWPYLLLEAQVLSNGKFLGPLGAILNAEVLKVAMQRANYSVYEKNDKENYSFENTLSKMGELGEYITQALLGDGYSPHSFNETESKTIPIMKLLIRFNK